MLDNLFVMKLIIAEKPIAAKRIAAILGKPKPVKKNGVEYYKLEDSVVVPLKGHVVKVDFPKQLNNWYKTDLIELASSPLEYSVSLKSIEKVLKSLARKADEVIIATDYDREGESIGKEALSIVLGVNPSLEVKRARFSSLTPEEVRKSFQNLSEFDENLADAADTRREIDLLWGAALTRFISLSSRRTGKQFLSVGRVQTPTLALIVEREKEIKAFKPKDYWEVKLKCVKGREEFTAVHEKEKVFNEEEAKKIKAKQFKEAIVVRINKTKQKLSPPTPFNTTEFLRAAASIGFQPLKAMSIAESLYMKGFISYPRTDNTYYSSIDFRKTLKMLSSINVFSGLCKKLLEKKKLTPTHGKKKATDHPPIHPVSKATPSDLSKEEWKVYELVVRRFMATLAEPSELLSVKAVLEAEGEKFIARGKTVIVQGWKEYYPYSKTEEEKLPELSEGEKVRVKKLEVEKKQTKPKKRYSLSELVRLMDKLGLGTKSTRAEILQKLLDRRYVSGKKTLTPSETAFAVVDVLEKHASEITKPEMTSKLEEEMDLVEKGKKKKEEVVNESRDLLKKVLAKVNAAKESISNQLREAVRSDKVLGKCLECGNNLMIIRTKKGTRFVGCTGYSKGCRVSFPLPAKGIVIPLNKKCPECGLPMVRVRMPGRKRYFEMCIDPNCVSKKDWGKKSENSNRSSEKHS